MLLCQKCGNRCKLRREVDYKWKVTHAKHTRLCVWLSIEEYSEVRLIYCNPEKPLLGISMHHHEKVQVTQREEVATEDYVQCALNK